MGGFVIAQVQDLKDAASAAGQVQDSAILGEQFYFFTVVLMWLIHAGFMSYEAGIARRKNVMATAMKNILTIAVVTPTFYYFGWWIYNCDQPGLPIGPEQQRLHRRRPARAASRGATPSGRTSTNNINLIFFLAFLLFCWTTASILSGAIIERARLSAYLVLAVILGCVVWILDAAWGWSAGGWLDAALRLPRLDRLRRRARRRGCVHARGALQRRAADRASTRRTGLTRDVQTAQPAHHRAGADADLHRLLRVLRRLPGDRVDLVPGLGEHLPQPDDARLDHDGRSRWASPAASPAATSPAAATRSGRSPAASRA